MTIGTYAQTAVTPDLGRHQRSGLAPDPRTLITVEPFSKSDRDDDTGRTLFESIS
jgi:hypothetical protein